LQLADLLKSLFMHLNIKPYLIVLSSVILLFILFACFRNSGFEKQIAEWGRKNQGIMKGILITVFLVFGAAAVPVFLKIFLTMQTRIGNADLPLIKLLREHAMGMIYTAWIIFGLGLVIALPLIIKNGYISNTQ
jgi:hypothetical protein